MINHSIKYYRVKENSENVRTFKVGSDYGSLNPGRIFKLDINCAGDVGGSALPAI